MPLKRLLACTESRCNPRLFYSWNRLHWKTGSSKCERVHTVLLHYCREYILGLGRLTWHGHAASTILKNVSDGRRRRGKLVMNDVGQGDTYCDTYVTTYD